MKPLLPYNLLLLLAAVTAGFIFLYNGVLRGQTQTTLQYRYPEVVREEAPQPDLERIEPEADEPPPDGAPSQPEAVTSVRFPLDVNTATAEQLRFIPRVGDVLSQRIVQYRAQIGGYTDLEQLRNIKGIGDSTYEHLYAYLVISAPQEDVDAGG